MKISESINLMKALGDSSRLLIVNSLMEKPQYLEELAKRLNLAVSTVSFHMKKLENANLVYKKKEQYYVVFYINEKIFDCVLKDIVSFDNIDRAMQDERIREYRNKVIETYFQGGKLLRIPSQYKKRLIILDEIIKLFEKNKIYPEKELDAVIKEINNDYCSIRRYFVDEKMMCRENGKYWIESAYVNNSGTMEPAFLKMDEVEQQGSGKKKAGLRKENKLEKENMMENENKLQAESKSEINNNAEKGKPMDAVKRKEIIRNYKQTPSQMGIYQVKNQKNGKILVGSTKNLYARKNRELMGFKLSLCEITELQEAWNELGENGVSFEVLDILEPKKDASSNYNYSKDLETLEELWLEKLQPYGEKGYNEVKVKRNK